MLARCAVVQRAMDFFPDLINCRQQGIYVTSRSSRSGLMVGAIITPSLSVAQASLSIVGLKRQSRAATLQVRGFVLHWLKI